MSNETVFVAQARDKAGKGAKRQSRLQGQIPAIVYGGKQPPQLISLEAGTIARAHATGKMLSRVYELDLAGKKTRVVPREVQVEPLRDRPIHVDLMRVEPGAKIALAIPVEFKRADAAPGIKRGGVLNIVKHEIELIVDADNIPDHIEADLTGLDINDSLHINAIALPPGTRSRLTRNFTVATIVAPSGHAEELAEAAAKAAAAAAAPAEGAAAPAAEGAAPPAAEKEKEKK